MNNPKLQKLVRKTLWFFAFLWVLWGVPFFITTFAGVLNYYYPLYQAGAGSSQIVLSLMPTYYFLSGIFLLCWAVMKVWRGFIEAD